MEDNKRSQEGVRQAIILHASKAAVLLAIRLSEQELTLGEAQKTAEDLIKLGNAINTVINETDYNTSDKSSDIVQNTGC